MKFKSSLTKEIKLSIFLLLLFLVINISPIINSNGIEDIIIPSLLMVVFIILYVVMLVNGNYLVIEKNSVKHVRMFALRKILEIEKINKIQKGSIGGLYKSLSLIYEENGNVKYLKIALVTFNKDTIKQFVSELIKQNPRIVVDQSASEFMA